MTLKSPPAAADEELPGWQAHATPPLSGHAIESALHIIGGKWKVCVLAQLFGSGAKPFAELERQVSGVSRKMLLQQLQQLEADGLVECLPARSAGPHDGSYSLTPWGRRLQPALAGLQHWYAE